MGEIQYMPGEMKGFMASKIKGDGPLGAASGTVNRFVIYNYDICRYFMSIILPEPRNGLKDLSAGTASRV